MRRKVWSSLAICVALAGGCGGTKWSAGSTPTTNPKRLPRGWAVYTDPSGITLQHPTAWTTQSGRLSPLLVFIDRAADSGGFRRNINVLVQPVSPGFTLAEYLRVRRQELSSSGGTLEEDRAATLGRLAGHEVIWRLSRSGKTIRFLSVWTLRRGKAYLLTYASDDANFSAPLGDVRRLIASVRLPKTP